MNFTYLNNQPSIDELLNGVSCISQAQAVEMCLDLLGSRSSDVVAILPVTSPPDVLTGAVRAGANPMLLDIDPKTLSFEPTALETVLQSIENAIVLLPLVGGAGVPSNIQSLLKDQIVILIHKELPSKTPNYGNEVFSIYDLSPYLGNGAVIRTVFDKQRHDLAENRDSPLGMYNNIPSILYKNINNILNSDALLHANSITDIYQDRLFDFSVHLETTTTQNFLIKVDDAFKVLDSLQEHGIEAKLACFPLYNISLIRMRWEDSANVENLYPQAHDMCTKIIALPTHIGISTDDAIIISNIIKGV